MFTELSRSRISNIQACVVYGKHSLEGVAQNFRDPDFTAEHFCVSPVNEKVAQVREIPPGKVQVSVPTLGLNPYAVITLKRIVGQIKSDFSYVSEEHLPQLVVVSNGSEDRAALDQFKRELLEIECDIDVTLICTPVPGKSNAVNLLHQHALSTGAEIIICMDDDLAIADGALFRLYHELSDGKPRFVGVRSTPDEKAVTNSVEADILSMILAKRRTMGWPAPIGRFNGLPVSIYPTITSFDVYDDVFLSAFFMINDIPQYVLEDAASTYKPSTSLYEYVKRTRRIALSDDGILSIIPKAYRKRFEEFAISPCCSKHSAAADLAWLEISKSLLSFAEQNELLEADADSLDKTDPSSKPEHDHHTDPEVEGALARELARLKTKQI